jgi:hypothetical protein
VQEYVHLPTDLSFGIQYIDIGHIDVEFFSIFFLNAQSFARTFSFVSCNTLNEGGLMSRTDFGRSGDICYISDFGEVRRYLLYFLLWDGQEIFVIFLTLGRSGDICYISDFWEVRRYLLYF